MVAQVVAVLVVVLAAVGTGVVAGVFFAFSAVVMPALRRSSPALAAGAMRAVNHAAVRWPLLVALFGTGLAVVVAPVLVVVAADDGGPVLGWVIAGAVVYVAGGVGVTIAGNVPLNNRIDRVEIGEARAFWPEYAERWTAWNDIRTASCVVACVLLVTSLVA
ncbi:putative membrane protein [Sediminihabitans luteus]|uniref:Putative membrane protein n=1 Tax=Sediminihabitans luteus TaxID=1138585 RepID=A0A2M9CY02_9CELL|nr:anthrone oxygenase family protein [Sediminihabitans luteus]PJJ76806.1 putative membrane protein [Sediminihabitans luteus]GIJ00284.1 membrane protein [Sediminihabitans luteus]